MRIFRNGGETGGRGGGGGVEVKAFRNYSGNGLYVWS